MSAEKWGSNGLPDEIGDVVRIPGATVREVYNHLAETGTADPESGHSEADRIHEAALRLIGNGYEDPIGLAVDVLDATSAEFPRWFA